MRTAIVITAALAATSSCSGSGSTAGSNLPPWAGSAAAVARLVTYDSCEQTRDALIESAKDQVGPYGFGGDVRLYMGADGLLVPAPGRREAADAAAGSPELTAGAAGAAEPGAVPGYSGTNVHEAGVDEPDLVKTDGRRLLTVTDGVLRVTDVASRRLTGELRLPADSWADQLLLSGDRVLLIARNGMYAMDDVAMSSSLPVPLTMPVGTELTVVDVAGAPRVLSTIQLEGDYVDARQVGSVARLVLRSYPTLPFTQPEAAGSERKATTENRRILERSDLADWLPDYRQTTAGQTSSGELVGCDAVHHVRGTPSTTMLTVTSLDLAGDLQLSSADSVSVATGGETVYGTATSLYVAESPFGWAVPMAAAEGPAGISIAGSEPQQTRTRIHKFDISGTGRPRYVASGSVAGSLLNQYSMSEYDQALRVASTLEPVGGPCCAEQGERTTTHSAVTVLAQDGDRLVPIGAVDGLGKGERIYSVRFIGPVGYVVTFRQTDPLYTIDLSDPRQPRVVGELKINGYSAYLHPAGEGRLIGVGQDATKDGQVRGTQVSLFDVSDPAAPRRLASYQLSGAYSEAELDPHAFLYWPEDQTIVVPVQGPYPVDQVAPDGDYVGSGRALVLRLNGADIDEVGMLTHQSDQTDQSRASGYYIDASIRRAVVIGTSLWTVSAAGVLVSDLQTLDGQQWIPFPQHLPKGGGSSAQPAPQPWPAPEPLPVDPPQ
ncbi:MAG TPA: beta-propeller domain-containing protein [Actinomycetes bacterium]|nr:beta-propeller domain-containing protein [Actinomycetes bacterium]